MDLVFEHTHTHMQFMSLYIIVINLKLPKTKNCHLKIVELC